MKGELLPPIGRPKYDLELCPWCGGPAAFECLENGRFSVGCNDSVGKHAECLGFQLMTTFATKREACIAWNTRAPSDLTAQLDKAREALRGEAEQCARIADGALKRNAYKGENPYLYACYRARRADARRIAKEIRARACLPATSGDGPAEGGGR